MILSQILNAIFCFETQNFCQKHLNKDQISPELKYTYHLKAHHHSLKCSATHKFECGDDYCAFNKEDCSVLQNLFSYHTIQLISPRLNRVKLAKMKKAMSEIRDCPTIFIHTNFKKNARNYNIDNRFRYYMVTK